MSEIRQVTVITANPTRSDDVGRAEIGFYIVAAGLLTMTDPHGVPLRNANTGEKIEHRLMADETPRVIAKRLTLKIFNAARGDDMAGFQRHIDYPTWNY